MPSSQHTLDEVAQLGAALFESKVRSSLRPEDDGKFVAIHVENGDYELDRDDYTALMRLRLRQPSGDVWLMRAGFQATCRIGAVR